MLNQLQNIRSFVERHLGELVSWNDAQVDSQANGDFASAVIPVKGKSYRLAVTSAYIEPPMGKITLSDLQTGHEINGARADAVWDEMARYVRARLDDEPQQETELPAQEPAPKPIDVAPDEREPYLGQGVKFITERNEFIGGMDELAAIVTKVLSPTKVSLTVFPMTGEVIWRNDVQRRSAERQHYCWDFSESKPDPKIYGEYPKTWLKESLHIMNSTATADGASESVTFEPPTDGTRVEITGPTDWIGGPLPTTNSTPSPEPPKRKRGRPFGSKNKPKQPDNENQA